MKKERKGRTGYLYRACSADHEPSREVGVEGAEGMGSRGTCTKIEGGDKVLKRSR